MARLGRGFPGITTGFIVPAGHTLPAYLVAERGNNQTASGTSLSVTLTGNVSAGNTVTVAVGASGGLPTSITDTKGNTWNLDGSNTGGGNNLNGRVWSSLITTPLTTSDSITVNFPSGSGAMFVAEWFGIVSGVDQVSTGTGNSGTADGGSATGATQVAITLGVFVTGSGVTLTPAVGYSALTASTAGTTEVTAEYRVLLTNGTQDATGALGKTTDWTAFTLIYRDVFAHASATRQLKYDILNQVSATRQIKYDIANQIIGSRQLKYDIIGQATATRKIVYDIQNQVSTTRKLVWDVAQGNPVSAQRQLVWDLTARPAATRKLVWDIASSSGGQSGGDQIVRRLKGVRQPDVKTVNT